MDYTNVKKISNQLLLFLKNLLKSEECSIYWCCIYLKNAIFLMIFTEILAFQLKNSKFV